MTTHLYTNTLREHRLKLNLLQSDIALLLGHSSTERISQWERGISAPNIMNLYKLCVVFRTTPFELYAELMDMAEDEVEERRIENLRK